MQESLQVHINVESLQNILHSRLAKKKKKNHAWYICMKKWLGVDEPKMEMAVCIHVSMNKNCFLKPKIKTSFYMDIGYSFVLNLECSS